MLNLIAALPPGARVLDLGARCGSFQTERADIVVVRADLAVPDSRGAGCYAAADAARLPFSAGAFDLIVSNHSLEHFSELELTVREIGRVIRAGGGLYVAVPDAGTLSDRIYRWVGRGGGHVNPFRSPEEVIRLVERLTGLPHRATRPLISSLSFLNRRNIPGRGPRRALLFGFGHEGFLAVWTWALRQLDRVLGTRLSHYGWMFYFGGLQAPQSTQPWTNVCVRCGSGHPEAWLRRGQLRRPLGVLESYRCPDCRAWNLLTRD